MENESGSLITLFFISAVLIFIVCIVETCHLCAKEIDAKLDACNHICLWTTVAVLLTGLCILAGVRIKAVDEQNYVDIQDNLDIQDNVNIQDSVNEQDD